MKVDGAFYGMALREMESGLRRDDLWAQAFIQAKGDESRTQSVYLELLASHLARTAGSPDQPNSIQATAAVVSQGRKSLFTAMYRWGSRLFISAAISGVITLIGSGIYFDVLKQDNIKLADAELIHLIQRYVPEKNIESVEKELQKTPVQILLDNQGEQGHKLIGLKIDFNDYVQYIEYQSNVKLENFRIICFIICLFISLCVSFSLTKKE